jgi:uncharacterized alkaline shock family protein YloU
MADYEETTTDIRQLEEISRIEDRVTGAVIRTAALGVTGVVEVKGDESLIKNITGILGQGTKDRGVTVTSGSREAIVDLSLVVRYGNPIPEIINNVRVEVKREVQEVCGLDAKVVNIIVSDIKFDGPDPIRAAQVI